MTYYVIFLKEYYTFYALKSNNKRATKNKNYKYVVCIWYHDLPERRTARSRFKSKKRSIASAFVIYLTGHSPTKTLRTICVAKQSLSKKEINRTRYNKSEKWFDEQLYIKRRDLNRKASNMFCNPFIRSIRDSYFKCYRQYRKLVKYKKKNFTKTVISQLDELETKDPKTYWKLVNSLKDESESESPEKSIDSNTLACQ